MNMSAVNNGGGGNAPANNGGGGSNGFNINTVATSMRGNITTLGTKVAGNSSKENMTEEEMMALQLDITRWSTAITVTSNVQKAWSDAFKSVSQNLR